MAGELERLVTQLVADTREYSRGLMLAQGQLGAFERATNAKLASMGSLFTKFGATAAASLSVGAIMAWSKAALDAVDNVGDLAAAAGVSAEHFQRLGYALSFSGVSASEFAGAMNAAAKMTGGFFAGQERAVKAFQMLGISADDASLKTKSQEQVIELLIGRLETFGSHQERVAAASRIFGDAVGPKLVAAAEQGGDAIRELMAQAQVFSDEQVRVAAEANDAWDRVTAAIGVRLKGALIDALAATGNFVSAFSLEQINNEVALVEAKLVELRTLQAKGRGDSVAERVRNLASIGALMGGKEGLGQQIEHLEKRLAALTAEAGRRLRAQHQNDPEYLAEQRRQSEAARAALAAQEKAQREAERSEAEAARRRAQAKRDSYQAEYEDLLRKYKREEDLARRQAEAELEIQRDQWEREEQERRDRAREAKQAMEDLMRGGADTIADLLTDSERAWDRMKQRVLATIAEIAIRWAASGIFGAPQGQQGGLLGAILGTMGTGASSPSPSFAMHARGGMPMTGMPAIVGERGPELFVPQQAGTIVPAGGFQVGAAQPQVRVEQVVEVSIEPGMTVTQERRRGIDGRERALVAVRSAGLDDVSRRGPLSRAFAAETGQRSAPRKGIS